MLSRAAYNVVVEDFPSFRKYLETVATMRLKKDVGTKGEQDLHSLIYRTSIMSKVAHKLSVVGVDRKGSILGRRRGRTARVCPHRTPPASHTYRNGITYFYTLFHTLRPGASRCHGDPLEAFIDWSPLRMQD